MNKRDVLSLLLLLGSAAAPALATPEAMNAALHSWNQQMAEYNAAVKYARTPEQQSAIAQPDGSRVAGALWKSVSAKTGQREVLVHPTAQERMRGEKPHTEKRDTFEFEETWAAPAVIWFANHPDALAALFENKPRQLNFYVDALLDAIERRHFDNPMLRGCIAKLAEGENSRSYQILEKIYARNPDPVARGYAALGMSIMLNNPLVAAVAGNQSMIRGKRVYYLKQALALTPEDAMFGNTSVSDIVVEQSYRLKHLSVGSVPPQITVGTLSGKTQTLPEVGKPTLLLFWHPSDPTSKDIARKLPTLNQKYPQLQLAAITAAADNEDAKKALADSGVEATFLDTAENTAVSTYRINQLPTAVLLGPRCTILYIGYPDMHLQAALDSCFQNQNQQKNARPHIRVTEQEAPAIQPGATPAPTTSSDEAPALRDMPEF